MTGHFTPDECLAAADGTLVRERATHAETCDACRREVDAARAFLASLASVDVPEPSPLFWEHFSARVRAATAADRTAATAHQAGSWRAWFALATTAASVVLAVWVVRQPGMTGVLTPSAGSDVSTDAAVAGNGADPWQSVMTLTSDWSFDDLDGLAAIGDAPVLIDELTASERAVFVQLLQQEMGAVQ